MRSSTWWTSARTLRTTRASETIGQLGERISRAAGLSSNLELVARETKLGGNGPIMGLAMLQNGCAGSYIGSIGHGAIHPVFADFAVRCRACYGSVRTRPHRCAGIPRRKIDARASTRRSSEVTYERMLEVVGLEKLKELWGSSVFGSAGELDDAAVSDSKFGNPC